MLPELARKASLYQLLLHIDQNFAGEQKQKGCAFCGGRLHDANYYRKPRGGPQNLDESYHLRHSLCCASEGCRRRTKPPTVRFLDRRVYWGCVILIVTALRQNRASGYSAGKLMKQFGMTRRTLKRWMGFFREIFPSSRAWQRLRGRVSPEISQSNLPKSLLDSFVETLGEEQGVVGCLRFLARGHEPGF
ncbi:MAG: hypothetical protein QNK37_24405 [Acidobacteriota bacterium]|nr:hypothetical protein [Acidobacteriota bacterium]